jgi:hypothetical protein
LATVRAGSRHSSGLKEFVNKILTEVGATALRKQLVHLSTLGGLMDKTSAKLEVAKLRERSKHSSGLKRFVI